jgi:hypothetical protein
MGSVGTAREGGIGDEIRFEVILRVELGAFDELDFFDFGLPGVAAAALPVTQAAVMSVSFGNSVRRA